MKKNYVYTYILDLEDYEIGLKLEMGFRLPRPYGICSEHYYRIMQLCWSKYESRRPTFTQLENKIKQTLQPSDSEEVQEIPIQLQEWVISLKVQYFAGFYFFQY